MSFRHPVVNMNLIKQFDSNLRHYVDTMTVLFCLLKVLAKRWHCLKLQAIVLKICFYFKAERPRHVFFYVAAI